MEQQRLKKIENTAQKIVGNYILESLSSEERKTFRLVNIVGVKLSSDLSYLDVFVSSFENPLLLTKALAEHARSIEKQMFKEMKMRKSPRIRFRYDDSGSVSSEILEKINSL